MPRKFLSIGASGGSVGAVALHLPAGLTARAFGPAWVIALAAHLGLVLCVLLAPAVTPDTEERPVRLVFLEPPPPPPARLGAPEGTGTVPTLLESKPVEVAVRPQEAPKPVVPDPSRLRRADPKSKRQAALKPAAPAPVAQQPAQVAVAEVAPGVSTGSVSGQTDGVVGGVDGGLVGGVVGGTGSDPVPVGQVANPPRVLHRVDPTYPEAVRRRGITGLVVLEAVIDREGHVEADIKVRQSIPRLNEEAIAAVRQWRFSPGRNRNGEAVRVILEIPIRFTLRS